MKKTNKPKANGFILIITVIIIAAIISVILISISLSAVTRLESTNIALQGVRATILAESCAAEGLLQLNRDNSYSGASFNLGAGSCTIEVSALGANKQITVTGTLNNYVSSLTLEASMSPFHIVTWDN